MKKLLSYLLTSILLIPGVFAAASSAGTVASRFTVFYQGILGAIKGNPAAFSVGLVAILPLIGIVVIVFGLMFFITKVTIFKSPDHDKYARMIAFGVAFIGLAQQSVFNAILGLSTSFLILSFIVAIVFMFIIFVNHNRKTHLTSHAELHKITGEALTERRNLEQIKHDLRNEKELYVKTESDLEKLNHDLNDITHLAGNEKTQIDKLANMLRKATAAQDQGNATAVRQYASVLSKDLAGLVTTMRHEHNALHHLEHDVSAIDHELARWNHAAMKTGNDEDHFKAMLQKMVHSWGGSHNVNVEHAFKGLEHEERKVLNLFKDMKKHLHELNGLKESIEKKKVELEKFGYDAKHSEARNVRDKIMSNDFKGAHHHLDNLRAMVEKTPHIIRELKSYSSHMRSLISSIESEEKKIEQLIKGDILRKLKEVSHDLKEAESIAPK